MEDLFVYGRDSARARKHFASTQRARCAICGQTTKRLVIDHEHSDEGLVRGLLCDNCNGGLGRFGDSVERLQAAIDYLQSHELRNDAYRATADWLEREAATRPVRALPIRSQWIPDRDGRIRELVVAGRTNRQIADELGLRYATVKVVAARVQ